MQYVPKLRQAFDFWSFLTPTVVIVGIFVTTLSVYYAKMPAN